MRSFNFSTLALTFFLAVASADAAVVDVDTTVDSTAFTACTAAPNDCSLRGAIVFSNATPEADVINLPAGTYLLTATGTLENGAVTGDLDISSDLTIVGAGAATTIVDGNGTDRVFELVNTSPADPLTVTLSGITVRNGVAPLPAVAESGGGIAIRAINNTSTGTTTLNLFECVVQNNQTTTSNGGGIAIAKNVSGGTPVLNIDRSTIAGNATTGTSNNGGGLAITNAQVNITNSTLSGNSASGSTGGGAIFTSGNLTVINITNSTLSGNSASFAGASGGAIRIPVGTVAVTLLHATIANNTAASGAGGITNTSGTVNATNSIIANNTGGNIDGTNGLNGTNVTNVTADFSGMFPLANNGGPTQTHSIPAATGPGLPKDAGTNAAAASLTFDQRGPGFNRIVDGTVDIGAFERQAPTAAAVSIGGRVTTVSGVGIANARLILLSSSGVSRSALSNQFGYYRFDDVDGGGQTLIIRVEAKRYKFEPRTISLFDSFTDLDFVAIP